MPYTKPREQPFDRMKKLLLGEGLNGARLADILCCSPPTARRKLNDPQLLTLEDLALINRRGHIPIETIREAVSP